MGLECRTNVRAGKEKAECQVYLETSELIIRGAIKRKFKFEDLKKLRDEKGWLTFECQRETIGIELNSSAAKWIHRIKNPRTRSQKLGLKAGMKTCLVGPAESDVADEIVSVTGKPCATRLAKGVDLCLLFAEGAEDLMRLESIERNLADKGAVWVLWPKGRRELVHEDVVEAGRNFGLVQTRSMGFSERLTGLRLTRPAANK